jgi:hypothetical protein
MLVLGKNGNMPAWDRLPLAQHLIATISLRTQGQQLRNLAMVKNTEILGRVQKDIV